jgi:hypothetical protein
MGRIKKEVIDLEKSRGLNYSGSLRIVLRSNGTFITNSGVKITKN